MSNSVDNVVITYTITGKRADGTDFTLTTSQSIGKNKSGTDGAPGSNAQVISLSSDAMAFRIAKDGTITPSTITFTANRQNISQTTTFSAVDEDGDSLTLGGSGDTRTLTATEFDNNIFAKVTATAGSFSDDITIVRLTEGSDAVTSTNSNPAHLFPADSSGNITSFSNSGTTIKVFEGTTALTFKTSTAAAGQFNIGTPTISTGTKSGGAISGDNTTTATVANYSAISADATTITYPISGKRADGTAFSFDIKQSFSKSKTGTPGAAGSDSKTVSLVPSSNVIEYNAAGGGGSGTITLTATSQNFTDGFFKFTGGGGAFTDETSFTNGTGANSDTATFTIPASYSSTPYTFTVSVSEGDQNEVASDTISIASIKPGQDGEDAYTIFLTNETHSFPAANDGTVANSDEAAGAFEVRVFKGTTQFTYDGTSGYDNNSYRIGTVTTSGITLSQSTVNNQRKFTPTAVDQSADTGTAVITIIDNSDDSSFTKTYTFSKSKAGAIGATGAGVVFRGDWNNSDTYTKSDIRRDIVDYSAVNSSNPYWIAKNTNSNSSPPSSGTSANTNWETFGATFTSVATDILFSQDVFAQRTVNIGASGGTPVIALDADDGNSNANPFIGINANSFNANNGIFLGFDSTTPKLSLKNSGGTRFFKWDGSDLDIQTSNLLVSSSAGSGVNQKDLIIDSSTPAIRVQKGATLDNLIDLDGSTGIIEVFSGGEKIFNSGETVAMPETIDRIINSAPSTGTSNSATGPITKVSNLQVGSTTPSRGNLYVEGSTFVEKSIIQQVTNNTTADSTVFLSEINPTSYSPDVPGSSPVQQVFNVRKNIGTGTGAGKIVMQSTAFNSTINAANGSAGVKFIDSGNTNLSSSLYQFQGILSQQDGGTSTGYFTNGNACLMSLDMDTQTMHSSVRQNFVYLQARRDIGEPAGLKTVFQVQGPNGAIATAGNITAFAGSFNQVSDQRLKKDIYTISGSMNKVLQLRPTEFTWIEQDKQDVGFIAQEVEEIIPEVIETTDGFVDSETGEKSHENTKTISYTKLIPYLVDTIQQMDKRIKELEERDN